MATIKMNHWWAHSHDAVDDVCLATTHRNIIAQEASSFYKRYVQNITVLTATDRLQWTDDLRWHKVFWKSGKWTIKNEHLRRWRAADFSIWNEHLLSGVPFVRPFEWRRGRCKPDKPVSRDQHLLVRLNNLRRICSHVSWCVFVGRGGHRITWQQTLQKKERTTVTVGWYDARNGLSETKMRKKEMAAESATHKKFDFTRMSDAGTWPELSAKRKKKLKQAKTRGRRRNDASDQRRQKVKKKKEEEEEEEGCCKMRGWSC